MTGPHVPLLRVTVRNCAAPDYVAPEMLMGQGVNQACDWWALGVMLYEMISSAPPFTDPAGEDMTTFANILKGELRFPPESECVFSTSCRGLITGLLTVKVPNRLGYLKGGAEDLIRHDWFATHLDWDALVNLTIVPPWRPALKDAYDTSHFDSEGIDECRQAQKDENELMLTAGEAAEWEYVFGHFGVSDPPRSAIQ